MENIARINLVTRFRILLVKELDLPPFLDRLDQAGEFLHIEGARMQVVKRIGTYTAHCNRNDLSGIIAQNIEKDTSHVARLCSSIFLDLFRSIDRANYPFQFIIAGYPRNPKFRLIPEEQRPAGVGLIFKKIPGLPKFLPGRIHLRPCQSVKIRPFDKAIGLVAHLILFHNLRRRNVGTYGSDHTDQKQYRKKKQ